MPEPAGVWLRRDALLRANLHRCDRPFLAEEGDVWRCGCGRRWTCVSATLRITDRSGATCWSHPAGWERRWWPWPR